MPNGNRSPSARVTHSGYCPGHREQYDGDRCPYCTERSRPGLRPPNPGTLRWPEWDALAPHAGAVYAVMVA